MTELQQLRFDLLKEWGNVKDAQTAYEFILNYGEQTSKPIVFNQADEMPDGVYIVQTDGRAILFNGNDTEPTDGSIKGIGIKYGSRSLVVALQDMADGDEITLTNKKDTTNANAFYLNTYLDAVADWNGEANTEHLKEIGLNKAIELSDGWYIPSLGEMYFIYTNLKAVNEALRFIDKDEIVQDWYWASAEYSATDAWYLYLSTGHAYNCAKASGKFRVRAVSAFIS